MNFTVLEFDDGIELVPNNWISNESCWWPSTITDRTTLNNLVLTQATPSANTWHIYTVRRVFCQASTYERGKEKLKLAMVMSDIDSGDESFKKSRHARHSIIQSSDDEGLKLVSNRKRHRLKSIRDCSDSEHSSGDEEPSRVLPTLPQTPESFNPSGVLKHGNKIAKQSSYSSSTLALKGIETDMSQGTPSSSRSNTPTLNASLSRRDSRGTDAKILHKLNYLISITKTLVERQNAIEKTLAALHGTTSNVQIELLDFNERFPIITEDELLIFDEELKDKEFFKKMVATLSVLGGTDVPNTTVNILRKLISNRVGNAYSFLGKKKKKAFKDLNMFNLIVAAVRKQKPHATESEIGKIIASWLPQSNLRLARELVKQNQSNE